MSGTLGTRLFLAGITLVLAVLLLPKAINDPGFFLQIVIYGTADGAIFALIALGYTMVYGIIELINFAHGDIFTLGYFLAIPLIGAFGLSEGSPVSIGMVVVLLVVTAIVMVVDGGINVVIERVAYRPLRSAPRLAILVISMVVCAVVNVTIERVAYRPLRHAPRLTPLITAVGMSFVLEGVMFL